MRLSITGERQRVFHESASPATDEITLAERTAADRIGYEHEPAVKFSPGCQTRSEMSCILDSLRAAADRDECQFELFATPYGKRQFIAAWTRNLSERFDDRLSSGECWGVLNDGRLGILLVRDIATDAAEDVLESVAARREWFLDALADAGCPAAAEYTYPLEPLAGHQLDRVFHGLPLYPEGGIEPFFAKPTPLWKRAFDMTLAVLLLVALLPLLLLVAVLTRLTSRGPIFFCQPRTGRGGRPFMMLKFRSMVVEAESLQHSLRELNEQDGPAFKMGHDPRITWLGHWLRRTCIDELPQLWNVLCGEMSLVGPRPLPLCESAACAGWQRRRLEVTPGITGLWQVRGRHKTSFDEWMQFDLEYIEQRSLRLDLLIMFSTIPSLIPRHRRSAAAEIPVELDAATDGATN